MKAGRAGLWALIGALALATGAAAQGTGAVVDAQGALASDSAAAETQEDGTGVALQAAGEDPEVIERLRAEGAQVVALGNATGVSGYLVHRQPGEAYAAYVTPGGGLLVGLLIGPQGEDVTARQLEEARKAGLLDGLETRRRRGEANEGPGGAPSVETLFLATQSAYGFSLGTEGPELHVFADRTCPFSVRHVEGLAVHALEGRLRLHVIPVGLLGERGALRAVEIAGSQTPWKAWDVAGVAFDRDVGAARVRHNMELHAAWKVRGVPFTVWSGPQGVRVYYGAGDAPSFVSDVVGG